MRFSRRDALRSGVSVAIGATLAGCSESGNGDSSGSTSDETDDGSSPSGSTRGGEWPQDLYDAANSGSRDEGVSASVSESWRVEEFVDGGGYSPGAVRIHQGVVMVDTSRGMFAYDVGSGRELWQAENGGFDNHVAIDGTVYWGTRLNPGPDENVGADVIAAYSVEDGSKTSELELEGSASHPLAVDESRVYAPINTDDGTKLAAIDRDLSEIAWESSYPSSYNLNFSPAVDDGVVYNARLAAPEANAEREVVAYDAETGEQLWIHSPDGIEPGIVAGPDTVYVGQIAIDAATGEERWTTEIESDGVDPYVSPPAVTNEAVVYAIAGVGSNELAIKAVDPDTGEQRWRQTFEWGGGAPFIAGETVYIGHNNGVTALSLADGSTEWESEIPEMNSIAILEDMLLVGVGNDIAGYTP